MRRLPAKARFTLHPGHTLRMMHNSLRHAQKVFLFLFSSLALLGPDVASGQAEWQPTCPECEISLTPVLTFGGEASEDTEGYTGEYVKMVRGAGAIYLIDYDEMDRVKVFSSDGEFLHVIGRNGEGPGEFREIMVLDLIAGDTLAVVDKALGRVSLFDPDHQFARSFSVLPVMTVGEEHALTPLPDHGFLVTGNIRTREMIGIPHHRFDSIGNLLGSFGDPPVRGSYLQLQFVRPIDLSEDGTVLVAHQDDYRVTRWTLDGEKLEVFAPVRRWFLDGQYPPGERRDRQGILQPRSGIFDIQESAEGLIWVIGRTPAAGWRESLGPDGQRQAFDEYYDYILDVFSPEGTLVNSKRIPQGIIVGFLDPSHIYGTVSQADGLSKVVIWTVDLDRPGSNPPPRK